MIAILQSIVLASVGILLDRASAPWNALDDAALRARAAVAITNVAPTVTAKKMMPPSGDKHDYMSFGPYWWPDPSKADGLPYVRRDGEENPQSRADSDRVRLERMVDDVEVLAAAARRFGDRVAGAEAVRKLRVFFLNPKTAMNPNLNFGQAIPGRCKGRGIGLIDTRLFVTRLLDAIAILERTGDLPKDDLSGLKAWFGNYLDWMLTSPIGLDEQDEHNNHGTAYDLQAAGLAWFVGRTDLARKILQEDTKKRIASQIQPDGSQPHELARTRALTYATMNATLFCELALLGEKVGVDLWRYETADGRSIRKAVEWLMPYWHREKAWTLKQITPIPPYIGRDASAIYSRHFKVLAEPMRQATGGCDTPIMAGLESLRSLAADRGYEITAVDSKPDFVKVAYVLRPSAESFIRCELALPAGREWDGRLWGFGNGGGAGGVHVDVDVARRGSVGVHTDMGTSKGVYGKPEVVRDFGWRATHLMTVSAKELATAYFGRAPSKSYFIGGSTGGGQGFHEALRFPADYDGIISYVPANTRIPLHVYFAWNLRLMKTADGKDVFSAAEFSAVEQAAIDWFADKDADCARGKFLTDSRYDAETARAVLDMAKGKCPSLAEGDKLERLHKMLEGPVLGGKRVHAGVPFSASFAAAAGNQWMLQWFLGLDRALHTVTDEELERWLRTWGPDCDACDAGFKAFAARGGKMIVIGGLEDSVVPYPSMIDWYERAAEEMGTLADLEQSCRLYLLPGRAHGQGRGCGGIVGDTQIIVDWVERGVAPFEVKSPLRGGGELSVKPYPHNWTPKAALGCAMRNILHCAMHKRQRHLRLAAVTCAISAFLLHYS